MSSKTGDLSTCVFIRGLALGIGAKGNCTEPARRRGDCCCLAVGGDTVGRGAVGGSTVGSGAVGGSTVGGGAVGSGAVGGGSTGRVAGSIFGSGGGVAAGA